MKKRFICTVLGLILLQSAIVLGKGGLGPCLATCFLADTRIGLEMNEGKLIEDQDWIRAAGSVIGIGPIVRAWAAYENGYKQAGFTGFLVGFIWGPRPGRMFKDHKLRSKEILMCIPCVNIYPAIALPCEAYNGKTMSEAIEAEGLRR